MSKPLNMCVICLSGGMDSTSLLLNRLAAGETVHGVSFDYGQKHSLELKFLEQNLQYIASQGGNVHHHTVDLSDLGTLFRSALINPDRQVPTGHYEQENMKATVVPNRNAIFASIAYGMAWSLAEDAPSPVKLCLGVHSGDHAVYPDCRPEFYKVLWKAFQRGNWETERVELFLPYLNMDKAQILQDAERSTAALGLEFDTVFSNTLTSYQPDSEGRAHGLTGSDVERVLAFDAIGRVDPIEYAHGWQATLAKAKQLQAESKGKQKNRDD